MRKIHDEGLDCEALERAKHFLCGYQLCIDMLGLRKYERRRLKRARPFEEECDCADILSGDEAYWRARMYEVGEVIGGMRNSRAKLVLYYRYIRGESIEHIADILGVSRRTGYRLHQKGLEEVAHIVRK